MKLNRRPINTVILITLTLLGSVLFLMGPIPRSPIIPEAHASPPNNHAILGLFSEVKKSNVVVDPSLTSPAQFKMDINVTDAGSIKGFDINITWTSTVLSRVNSTFAGAGCLDCLFAIVSTTSSLSSSAGSVRLSVVDTDSGTPFVNGNGVLFRVAFNTPAVAAATVIHIQKTSLIQNPSSVQYDPIDGYFDDRVGGSDFAISENPTLVTITRPVLASATAAGTTTVNIPTQIGLGTGGIVLQALGLPINTGGTNFSPASCASAPCTSTFTITVHGGPKSASGTTPSGTFNIAIIGNTTANGVTGSMVKATWLRLVISPPAQPQFNFSAASTTINAEAGSQTLITLNATLTAGANDTVAFGTNCNQKFASAICTTKPQTGGLVAKPGFITTLNVTTSPTATAPGTYSFNATATTAGTYSEVVIVKIVTITMIIKKTHDLAVSSMAMRDFAYEKVSQIKALQINVTVSNIGLVTETSQVNSTARVVLLSNDCRLAYIDLAGGNYVAGDTVVVDGDCNGLYGWGLTDGRIKFVNATNSPTETWATGKSVILDVASSGTWNPALTDTLIAGSATYGKLLTFDPKIKFVGPGSTWAPGNSVVYDTNGNGLYDAGEPVIAGATPAVATALKLDSLIKFIDANTNNVWDPAEAVVYDINNNGVYDPETVISGTAPVVGTFIRFDPKLEFVDNNLCQILPPPNPLSSCNNGLWDPGETVFFDTNGNHVFDTGEPIIVGSAPAAKTVLAGATPAVGAVLTFQSVQKMSYVDSNLNSVWDTGETVVWDANSNGLYDAGELVVPGTGPAPSPGILLGTPGTVTLLAGQSRTITLNWTSSDSLPRGRYMIGAAIAPVTGEFNTANNGILFFQFVQRLRGDANADCTVNILDVGVITGGLGQTFGVGDPRLWRPAADMNNDLTINILDIGVVTGYLGHTCTTG